MRIVFPYYPLGYVFGGNPWRYLRWRPWRIPGWLVQIDPYRMTSEARWRVANDIAATTPFSAPPSADEQDRRGRGPLFVMKGLLMAEQDRTRSLEAKLAAANEKLASVSRELSAMKRAAGEPAGSGDGLQNR